MTAEKGDVSSFEHPPRPVINRLGMERPQKRLKGWDFVQVGSLVETPDEMADLWKELGPERRKLAENLHEFEQEIASREDSEAIYWNHFEIVHVRVCKIQLSSTSVFARLHLIPFPGEKRYRWPTPSSWPFACSWRRSWHCDEQMWNADGRGIFFSRDVIDEVTSIRAVFPYSSKFEFPEQHFFSMLKSMLEPLQSFLVRTASRHVHTLGEILDNIGQRKQVPMRIQAALQAVVASVPFYPSADEMGKLMTFIVEVESEKGRSLTKIEAGELIESACVVGRVFGAPF